MKTILINEKEVTVSKQPFEGYTHRFKVQFEIGEPSFANLDLYANTDSYEDIEHVVDKTKKEKVISFKVIHRASKEQDRLSSELLDETLKGI